MTLVFIGMALLIFALVSGLVGLFSCVLGLHNKGPHDPPWVYITLLPAGLGFLLAIIGATWVTFHDVVS